VGAVAADLPRILNMTVPQVGHLPLMAFRAFFMVSSTPLEISFLALHLTQYPSAINIFWRSCFMLERPPELIRPKWQRQFQSQNLVKQGF
jgi:hypothetical protein